ncbi:hypothetical protein FSP39_024640 [Pinctada imbricata]|uniref:ATP-dependent DNA helicase n=1 Tax=Pinctada imbricata TaxID=66713 RepID=A0AA88YJP1_PINIB|nr:hypothetical protein FSP39_024640 [Pinctada imbricata]
MTEEDRETKREENRLQHQKQRGNFTEKERGEKRKADRIQHQKQRENLMEEEKRNKREENRLQYQKRSENLTEEEKRKKREENRLQHEKGRENLTEEERGNKRDADRIQHQKQRENLTEEERGNKREKNRLQHQKQWENLTEEERGNKREMNRLQHQKRREDLTEEERGNKRDADRIQHQKQRENLTEEERGNKREKNRLQHQKQRENLTEEERGNKREMNRLQHQKRREDLTEEERGNKRDKDRIHHQKQRENLTEEERGNKREKNRLRHQKQRENLTEEERGNKREMNRLQHQKRREVLTEEERGNKRDEDRIHHQKQRENLTEEERGNKREKNRLQHQKQRENLTEEERGNKREMNRLQHQKRREDLPEEERGNKRDEDRIQHQKQRENLTEIERGNKREEDRLQHQKHRENLTEEEKGNKRVKDRMQHQKQREKMTEEERGNKREENRLQHLKQRENLTEEERGRKREKDKQQHETQRQNLCESKRNQVREKDRVYKKKVRSSSRLSSREIFHTYEAVENVIQHFFKSIKDGPNYSCCVCYRYLYRTSVKRLRQPLQDKALQLSIWLSKESDDLWICLTCANYLTSGKLPAQAQCNNLAVTKSPEVLKKLFTLEKQIICKIIPFMKIFSLPKGSQHGLKGQVVLVPSNVQKTAQSLPRETQDAQLIALHSKRRLSDKNSYSKEFIRPKAVNDAIQYLLSNNNHYSDIQCNDRWSENSKDKDGQLWSTVERGNDQGYDENSSDTESSSDHEANTQELTDSEEDIEKNIPSDVAENLHLKRSVNSSTCLYPEEGPLVRSNKILNIAPAEGQTPTSVFYQEFWETAAFPGLFPDGKNTFHEERKVPISPKKYVNARLLSKDSRFAESAEYTFQCLHWIESTSVNESIKFSLKKTRQSDLSVGALQNPDNLQRMFKEEEIFASFKRITGTPQYWKDMQLDMIAKIRHFGPYTFFITGSAADFHWPELIQVVARQYGEFLDLEYIENSMDKKTKRMWLTRNPVTVACHIDFIFRKLWGNVILSGVHPIGQILNYDIRKEMQSRGTAHFHSAVHVQNAPKLDKDTDQDVIKFVDKYISCSIPPEDNSVLSHLVTSRQMHHHTRTCTKKKGVKCRFHYPKPPSSSTVIARSPIEENAKSKIDQARGVILKVMDSLSAIGTGHTLNEILKEAGISREDYEKALTVSMKKTNIILKRDPSETCVNPYNPIILRCLRANMDIQFITDVWACVAYITSYMCKPEKTMSELMRVACKEADTVKTKLKSIGNVFLKSREVSQHEAVARLVGLPLKETNTPVLFIPTGYKNQRTRMIKPRYVLEKMKDDDTDIFVPNIIDKYAARPAKLEKMCLAEFSSIYVSGKKKSKDEIIDENDDVHTNEQIKLKDNLGILCKRKTPFVLRDYPVSKERDSEKFFHRLLLLYLPFRDESELEDSESFKTKFSVCQHTMEKNIKKFEPYLDEVQAATEDMEQLDIDVEEIWERLAPQAEQNRNIDLEPGSTDQFLDPDNLTLEQHNFQHEKTSTSNYPKQHSVTRNITLEPTSKYEEMVRSLNQLQREIHDHIYVWCRQMALATSAEDEPPPFHIFLSGGAGVGKSHVVHTIYQSASRCLRKAGDDTELPKIVLTAPTGKAAVNIGGTTLHSAFHLPVKQRGQRSDYKSPSSTLLNTMRAMYLQMKILIIDEISMVGANTLSNLNLTLQNIFENDKPFGDKAVLAVGDLLQLNPVGEKAVYKQVNTGYAALSTSVWDIFDLFELDEIVRQKGDPEFANLLSRVRIGKQTESDITTLKSLEQNFRIPNDALSIFLTNELKDMYNNKQLDQLSSKVYTIKAKDTKRDLHSGCIVVNITSTNPHETGGLASEIQVALMAKYMQTKNVDISDGLVNGATGIIMKLDIPEKSPLQGTLYVKFDDPKVGKNARKQSCHHNLVPIRPISVTFALTEKSAAIQVERTQFPGTLAWGVTVHKSQGSTFEQMVGDMTTPGGRTNTMPGQIYTMLSRAKPMKGLRLCSFDPDKIKINSSALSEMERLQSNKQLDTFGLQKCSSSPLSSVSLAYLNIRSLAKHCKDFDAAISSTLGFVCLSETKVCRYSRYPFCSMRVVSSSNKYHGTVIYTSYEDAEELFLESELFELAAAIWNELLIVAVYVSPGKSHTEISQSMSELLRQIDESKESKSVKRIIIIGDFNIAFGIQNFLLPLLQSHGLHQMITEPTHQLGSILDLVFTNITDCTLTNVPVWFSDHHGIILQFSV